MGLALVHFQKYWVLSKLFFVFVLTFKTIYVLTKILLGPGILFKLATYKLSLFTFCLPSQGRQTQLVGCKFGLNTRTKQNLENQGR